VARLQSAINVGVNMGVLPTKGSRAAVSYGGSSLAITLLACGLLLRVHHETCAAIGASVATRAALMSGPILIMAGGTGGHVFPALAWHRPARRRARVVWLGTRRGARGAHRSGGGFPSSG
jgi:hypothetical protein